MNSVTPLYVDSTHLYPVMNRLIQLGYSETMAMQVLGLRPLASSFRNIPGQLALDVFVTAIARAKKESGDPLFCIKAGLGQSVADFSTLSQLAFFSRDLNQVLELYCQYLTSVNPGFPTRIEKHDDVCDLPIDNLFFSSDEAAALMELRMASCVRMLRIITINHPDDPIAAVNFSHAAALPVQEYQQQLRCKVHFSQARCSFALHSHALSVSIPTHNQHMLQETIEKAEQKRQQQKRNYDHFIARVQTLIRAGLQCREADLEHVANALVMSKSTFKRHLRQRGTSFQRILDDVRREEIGYLLHNTQLSVREIAERAGLSSASALGQACRRLLGCSALEYRKKL